MTNPLENMSDFTNHNQLSILKNPFSKEGIKNISIYFRTNAFNANNKYWYCVVEFKNGNTSGEQRLGDYGPDEFNKLMKDLDNFIKSL